MLVSCGGNDLKSKFDELDRLSELRDEGTDEAMLEDKEYSLYEVLNKHSELENKNAWDGKEVKFYFVNTRDASNNSKFNDSLTYSFTVNIDHKFVSDTNFSFISMYCDPKFYMAHPKLNIEEGDTTHAIGILNYSTFGELDIDHLQLVGY